MDPGARKLRVAVFGTGYWAQFQIAAWQAIGVEVAALWNRTHTKALQIAVKFGIASVYMTPEEVFEKGSFDIADIITDVDAHERLVLMAAAHGKAVICQKPMAPDLLTCERMVAACRDAGVWFAVHENFRYQPPYAYVKEAIGNGSLGLPLHAHIQMKSPDRAILDKQPALAIMDHMVLRDMGPHIFDVARNLFGDVSSVYSRPVVSYSDIGVQDSAVSLLVMKSGLPVLCTLAHNYPYKVFIQFQHGELLLDRDDVLRIVQGGRSSAVDTRASLEIPAYIPREDVDVHGGNVFAAIPRCLEALCDSFLQGKPAATSGADNLESMRVVFAAIRSQDEGQVFSLADKN
jgi:predicted dehydrogenase